jgi:hypothetical protein
MVKAAKTAKQGMASIERSINAPPARSAAASRPVGQRTAVGVNPPGFNGDSTINGALDNDVAVSERLQGAEAAAEMLFEMRAANDGNPTPEEAEMLSELRAVCEQHLNVLARSVERGAGLISETLLMKCIGTAESLVAAIGDGEKPGGLREDREARRTRHRARVERRGMRRASSTSSGDWTWAAVIRYMDLPTHLTHRLTPRPAVGPRQRRRKRR